MRAEGEAAVAQGGGGGLAEEVDRAGRPAVGEDDAGGAALAEDFVEAQDPAVGIERLSPGAEEGFADLEVEEGGGEGRAGVGDGRGEEQLGEGGEAAEGVPSSPGAPSPWSCHSK